MAQATSEEALRAVTIGELAVLAGPVTLAEYDPEWPASFAREAARIRRALGHRVHRLEHVGSTSIPGLAAKPVIDMVLAVPDSADEPAYVPPMEAAGYILRIREPQWLEHRLFKDTAPDANIHVFTEGTPEIDRMIAFRDWLRSHDDDRLLYERTKRELAAREWKYVQHYADAKTEVVAAIMGRALAGPTAIGSDQGDSATAGLAAAIKAERRRLARGDRPLYHVTWMVAAGGAVDVTVREFPIVHVFVPDPSGVLDGGRFLIARTLAADPQSFDVTVASPDIAPGT